MVFPSNTPPKGYTKVDLGKLAKTSNNNQVSFYHRDMSQFANYWHKKDESYKDVYVAIIEDIVEQPYADMPTYKITHSNQVAYHENHGSAHAMRQQHLAKQYLSIVKNNGASPHKEAAEALTEEEAACVELAAFMFRSGRTNERGGKGDPSNAERSSVLFKSVARQMGFNDALAEGLAIFMCSHMPLDDWKQGKVNLKGAEKGFKATSKVSALQKAMMIKRVLDMSHHNDLIRCWKDAPNQDITGPLKGQLIYLLGDTNKASNTVKSMMNYAYEMCKSTGAKVIAKGLPFINKNEQLAVETANKPKEAISKLDKISLSFSSANFAKPVVGKAAPYDLGGGNKVTGIEKRGEMFIVHGSNNKNQARSIQVHPNGSIRNFEGDTTISGFVDKKMKNNIVQIFQHFHTSLPSAGPSPSSSSSQTGMFGSKSQASKQSTNSSFKLTHVTQMNLLAIHKTTTDKSSPLLSTKERPSFVGTENKRNVDEVRQNLKDYLGCNDVANIEVSSEEKENLFTVTFKNLNETQEKNLKALLKDKINLHEDCRLEKIEPESATGFRPH